MKNKECPYCKAELKKEDIKNPHGVNKCPVCGNDLIIGVINGKLFVDTV